MSQRSPLSDSVLCGQYSVWYLEKKKGGGLAAVTMVYWTRRERHCAGKYNQELCTDLVMIVLVAEGQGMAHPRLQK